jgi:hypothetical protein
MQWMEVRRTLYIALSLLSLTLGLDGEPDKVDRWENYSIMVTSINPR